MNLILAIVLIVVAAAAGIGIGFASGVGYRKKFAEREIGSAEQEATRLINEAIRSGESRKKEMLLEAKDEIHKSRTEHEKEVKERRAELTKQERRLQQKEETLDKKTDAFEKKEEDLARRMAEVAEIKQEAEAVRRQHIATLEQLSGLTQEQAKAALASHLNKKPLLPKPGGSGFLSSRLLYTVHTPLASGGQINLCSWSCSRQFLYRALFMYSTIAFASAHIAELKSGLYPSRPSEYSLPSRFRRMMWPPFSPRSR